MSVVVLSSLLRSVDLLRLARFFATVASEGHFGHAADQLGISQPSLSQGLARLEAHLGVQLLDRGPRSVTLTAAGAALLPHADRLLEAAARLRHEAAQHATPAGVSLAVVAQLPAHLVAALATAYERARPGVGVQVRTATTAAVVAGVAAGRFAHGVVLHPAVVDDLTAGEVVVLPTDLLVPADLAPPAGAGVGLRGLLRRPLAMPAREHAPAVHDLLLDTLLARGVRVGTTTVDDDRSALALVAAGRACATTADPGLHARGVTRLALPDHDLALRVRVVSPPAADEALQTLLTSELIQASAPPPPPAPATHAQGTP